MWIILLAAAIAVFYWGVCTAREQKGAAEPEPAVRASIEAEVWRTALPSAAEAVAAVADVCLAVVAERQLGSSGSLTVQFPRQLYAEDFPTVTCQFLDREEGLYARVVRRELDRDLLLAEGIPEALFAFDPTWSAEGGGTVILTAEIHGIPPVIERRMARFQDREETLAALAAELAGRYPRFSVYSLAGEVLFFPRG